MHLAQEAVLYFHEKMNQTIGDPRSPDVTQDVEFRLRLINEELEELTTALAATDVVKTADGLADLVYVLVGCAVTWGIDLASVFDEVHRSNMTKEPGNASSGGKAIKGPNFSPADVEGVLKDAAANYDDTDDGWWKPPTRAIREVKHEIVMYDPSQASTDKIMASAKDQAKILAMKSIKADFVPVKPYSCKDCCDTGCVIDPNVDPKTIQTEGDLLKDCSKCNKTDENYPLQSSEAWKANHLPAEMVPELHKKATVINLPATVDPDQFVKNLLESQSIKGEMTPYGAYVFDCECGRRHAVQAKLGTRGGLADKGSCECICGKAYMVDFTTKEPKVEVTTIEEMRKAHV